MRIASRSFFIIVILLLLPLPAAASETAHDIAVIASLAVIDYNQSVEMFFENEGLHEINPLLGANPSRGDLLLFGFVGVGMTYVLSKTVPDPWRRVVLDSIIATERFNIEENRRLYLGWNTEGPPARGRQLSGIPIVVSLRF